MHTLDLLLGTSLALFAATDPASAGTVHVVDPTGSGDFTTLQEAADAALEVLDSSY